jgi:hypothetical protein
MTNCFYLSKNWHDLIEELIDEESIGLVDSESRSCSAILRVNQMDFEKADNEEANVARVLLYDGTRTKWCLLDKSLHNQVVCIRTIERQSEPHKFIFETCVLLVESYRFVKDVEDKFVVLIEKTRTIGRSPLTLCVPKATHSLAQLTRSVLNTQWSIEAVLICRGGVSPNGTVERMLLRDKTGDVEMAIFKDQLNRDDVKNLKTMAVYRIEGADIKYAVNSKYRLWTTKTFLLSYDLHCIDSTKFTLLPISPELVANSLKRPNEDDDEADKSDNQSESVEPVRKKLAVRDTNGFVPFGSLLTCNKHSYVNIIGLVAYCDKKPHKAGEKAPLVRHLYLVDKANIVFKCAFWGEEAKKLKQIEPGGIVIMRGAKICEYKGLYLSKEFNTNVTIMTFVQVASSFLPEVEELRIWWQDNNENIQLQVDQECKSNEIDISKCY